MNCGSGFLIIETSSVASESTIARMAQMVEQVSSCIGCCTHLKNLHGIANMQGLVTRACKHLDSWPEGFWTCRLCMLVLQRCKVSLDFGTQHSLKHLEDS